jgi:hypothetical protein
MGAALCRVLAPSAAAQEVLRLLEYCLSEEEKLVAKPFVIIVHGGVYLIWLGVRSPV